MVDRQQLEWLLDSLKHPFVFVDTAHVIRYMNRAAIAAHDEGAGLVGRSLFDCHGEGSKERILSLLPRLEAGEEEILIVEAPDERIYMRGVRDDAARLVGYYERYERASVGV